MNSELYFTALMNISRWETYHTFFCAFLKRSQGPVCRSVTKPSISEFDVDFELSCN